MTRWSQYNKYRNQKCVYGDMTFDSKKERDRYIQLRVMENAGLIQNLRRQVKYEVIPKQVDVMGHVIERATAYVADFVYEKDGETVVEDTKGERTRDYIIKRKLMLWRYGIRVQEI